MKQQQWRSFDENISCLLGYIPVRVKAAIKYDLTSLPDWTRIRLTSQPIFPLAHCILWTFLIPFDWATRIFLKAYNLSKFTGCLPTSLQAPYSDNLCLENRKIAWKHFTAYRIAYLHCLLSIKKRAAKTVIDSAPNFKTDFSKICKKYLVNKTAFSRVVWDGWSGS